MGIGYDKAAWPPGLGWLHDLLIEANVEVVKGATKWYKSYPQILSYLVAIS